MGRRPLPDEKRKLIRTIRLDSIWDEVKAAAAENGEKLGTFVERALRRELDRQKRLRRRQAKPE